MHQPWRSFSAIINKCLSGKTTALESLCLSRAQLLWVMYHNKNVDYVYLLWEDLVFQVENKNSKKNNVDYFMAKDKAILRRNKMFWYFAMDDSIKLILTSPKKKHVQAPKGKRLKATANVPKSGKKKLLAQGLKTLSEIALSEDEQIKIATKRSKTQFHSSLASGSGADKGTGSSDDEDDDADSQGDDDQDDDNEQTESDNDGDDFLHPKLSTFIEKERHDEKQDEKEEGLDLRVQTPSHFESTDDEAYDDVTQGVNVEKEKLDEDKTNKEEEVDELYSDMNINLEGRDTKMTDASLTNVQTTQVIEDTHVIMTVVTPEAQQQRSSVSSGFISNMLNHNLNTIIDSIVNLNTESTSLVDVLVTTNLKMHPSSVTTLPLPPIPLIKPQQLTAVPLPIIVSRDEAQAENEDFINKLNENIKKIVKEQVKVQVKKKVSKILPRIKRLVNDQLESDVLTRLSNEAKTSHVVAANLSELEHKKILIDKIESNKSIYRSVQQKTLYKALIDTYEPDKVILDTYGDTVTIKRHRDNKDDDEEPFAGSNRGSKRRRAGKEHEC
uniref:Retrovirus-related Pol polyprotein from transposon TNT 1-94 n=1 Tax=Tanacetum cinerariifolium TaxID=118510 RepID=A0A699I6J1_TANCI|nr:hypothetical protein [Tanacetum cinerariifolium]